MDRTERFYKIESLIRSRGVVPFDHMRSALEVSRATLNRDLQYLRDRMNAPIVFDRDKGGYRFEDRGAEKPHELPGVWFSEQEVHALMTMNQMLAELDDSGILARHLRQLQERLEQMLAGSGRVRMEFTRRIKVIGTARRKSGGEFFGVISSALLTRKRLLVNYTSHSDRVSKKWELSPQRLVHHRHAWYLDAWCHLTNSLRTFSLDAFKSATILDEFAEKLSFMRIEEELDGAYGIIRGGPVRWATLVFSAHEAHWVSREEWHPQQKACWLDDGRYELRVPYADPTELAMDVLRHGENVAVAPDSPELRAVVTEKLRKALAQYGPSPRSRRK